MSLRRLVLLAFLSFFTSINVLAQRNDSTFSIKKKRSIFGLISRDTTKPNKTVLLNIIQDRYLPYTGKIIRQIDIERLPFGTSLQDRNHPEKRGIYKLANKIHRITREEVVHKNLFFNEGDTLNPFLFADNERYLRELPFFKDAIFEIRPIAGTDSVDVVAVTKDLFSLGVEAKSLRESVFAGKLSEDNFNGSGNSGVLYGSVDTKRKQTFLLGGEVDLRNIRGSFTNQKFGYQNYYRSIRAMPREENYYYYNLSKPLFNRFMNITYEIELGYHSTSHRYNSDSLYKSDYRYGYYQFDGWLGYNFTPKHYSLVEEGKKLRKLAGVRMITQQFIKRPEIFKDTFNWQFADLSAVLGSFTLYRQNFLRTRFVYGFGVNEDIPVGVQFTATLGYTIKNDVTRPYIGFNFQRSNLLKNDNYVEYILRAETFMNSAHFEDVNVLGSINYFDRLKRIGSHWTQRTFLSFSASRQINSRLSAPLLLDGRFAIPEYGYKSDGGDARISAMGESVFFSPWAVIGFKLAPIVSINVSAFSPHQQHLKIFTSIGAGVRTRNESLVFGTIELKGLYFPRKDAHGNRFGAQFLSNIEFRRLTQLIRKPDFIQIN